MTSLLFFYIVYVPLFLAIESLIKEESLMSSVEINWDEKICIHAGECVKGLPQVFKVEDGKFVIDPGGASVDEIRGVVAKCPSGALSIK